MRQEDREFEVSLSYLLQGKTLSQKQQEKWGKKFSIGSPMMLSLHGKKIQLYQHPVNNIIIKEIQVIIKHIIIEMK